MTGARGPAVTGLSKQLKSEQARVVVPFEDNRHLNRLLGEYDGHLALLEDRLGIVAQAHGNVVTLTRIGSPARRAPPPAVAEKSSPVAALMMAPATSSPFVPVGWSGS